MKITKEIYDAHRDLSRCSAAFLEFAGKNPDCLERAGFNALLTDKRFAYFSSQPWPTFINEKKKKEADAAALAVYDLITSIIPRFFSYDAGKISSYYEIDKKMTMLLLHGIDDDYLKNLLGRGDFILTPSGQFKCLEFNMQTHLGGWELDFLEPLYVDTPVIARFLKESGISIRKRYFFSFLFEHILGAFLDKHPACRDGKTGEINMAMVFPRSKGFIQPGTAVHLRNLYKPVLQRKNNALQGDLFLCGYDALKVRDDFLVYGHRKIHILVEMSNGHVPIMFMEAVRKGNLMLYNGPVTRLMSNKLNLALLSENQDSGIFSLEEQEAIKKYVPWTRKVVPGLKDFMLSHREHLVLKSAEGLGGDEVFPGFNVSPGEWAQRVEKALEEKRWVVQEYVSPSSHLYQNGKSGCTLHHSVWGFFVFGSHCAGGFVRVLPGEHDHGVINSHQGAEESIILEVMEP